MKTKPITRRKLLKDSTLAAIGASVFLNSPLKVFGRSKDNLAKVILVRDKNVLSEDRSANKEVLKEMLDKAMLKLTGESSVDNAWKIILKPDDVLGIKTNVWNNLPTPSQLEEVLKEKAMHVGIAEENIGIKDRGVLGDEIFERSTALINVRPMRTHNWSGVGSLLKNYIMFVDKPYEYHGDSCADLAKIWKLDHVKDKTKLNILVMLTPLFHGVGPHHFNKQFTWEYNGLLVGFDPVAVDSVGLRIIQAKRKEYFREDTPINPPAKHILMADTRHHLGTADPNKIDLIRIGDTDGSLI
ncbi:MAG: DUF362 domain-containing protein [Bacteroidales bacterium]|nr:DUF362 domain-containing protein [Bacteroidales bacterium]